MRSLSRVLAVAAVIVVVVGGSFLALKVLVPQPAAFVDVPVSISSDCVVSPKTAYLSVKANNQLTWTAQGSSADVQFQKSPFHNGKEFSVSVGPSATGSGPLKRRAKLCAVLAITPCEYDYTVTQNGRTCDPRVIVTR